MLRRFRRAAGVLVLVAVMGMWPAIAAAPAAGAGTGDVPVIRISDFRFRPRLLTVSPGAEVRIRNRDWGAGVPHTVTADDHFSFDSGTVQRRDTFTAPLAPGEYGYHCHIHPEMRGTLVVAVA